MSIYDKINAGVYKSKLPYDHLDRAVRQAWIDDSRRLDAQFKLDLFDEHEVSENPKREKAFEIAWDQGHSAGLSEVASYFSDIVELIK